MSMIVTEVELDHAIVLDEVVLASELETGEYNEQ